jgi:hypothetical protein
MPRNSNLNDLQLILLATAIQRDNGSILPLPDSVGEQPERARKAIPSLLRRQLISEVPVTDLGKTWREEHQQRIGLAITASGRTIIAAGEPEERVPDGQSVAPAPLTPSDVAPASTNVSSQRALPTAGREKARSTKASLGIKAISHRVSV